MQSEHFGLKIKEKSTSSKQVNKKMRGNEDIIHIQKIRRSVDVCYVQLNKSERAPDYKRKKDDE